MNRKDRRALKKQMGKESSEKLSQKIFQFNQLGEECLVCTIPFDKEDREMVESWTVVVREDKEGSVRLYCPTCWQKAQHVVEEYMKSQGKNHAN